MQSTRRCIALSRVLSKLILIKLQQHLLIELLSMLSWVSALTVLYLIWHSTLHMLNSNEQYSLIYNGQYKKPPPFLENEIASFTKRTLLIFKSHQNIFFCKNGWSNVSPVQGTMSEIDKTKHRFHYHITYGIKYCNP